jgi:hypothetical protein
MVATAKPAHVPHTIEVVGHSARATRAAKAAGTPDSTPAPAAGPEAPPEPE